jgi:DnaJ-class molecular chaperone
MDEKLYVRCPVCDGKRRYPQLMHTAAYIAENVEADCPTCRGEGYLPATMSQITAVMQETINMARRQEWPPDGSTTR